MNDSRNPLSPHVQIYRWHISSLLSITHRISGVINLLALIFILFWLLVLSATCVRVPVFVGHSESVNIEFNTAVNAKKIRECLEKAPGCKVVDETKDGGYITPVESSGDFVTYISRIREDKTQKNSINMWVVSDNLLKGAALNAVQIANVLIKKYIN